MKLKLTPEIRTVIRDKHGNIKEDKTERGKTRQIEIVIRDDNKKKEK